MKRAIPGRISTESRMPGLTRILWAILLFAGGCAGQKPIEQLVRGKSPVAAVSARRLLDTYLANQIQADEKYKGQVIEVTGAVASAGVEFPNTPYLMLNASDIGSGVQCFFSPDHKDHVKSLQTGARVSIRGRCEGFNQGVRIEGCILE